jgi:GT2 family glycosyltransferase
MQIVRRSDNENQNIPFSLHSIAVIIVSYQSAQDLDTLIPKLISYSPSMGLEIIVVDNASSDNTNEILDNYENEITAIRNRNNSGFATAVNQGIQASRAPYVLLLNPDADLNITAIKTLKQYLDQHSTVAAVAPKMLFPDGRLQPSRGTFPSLPHTIAHLYRLKRLMPDDEKIMHGPLKILGSVFRQYSPLPEEDEVVDYTTGACVLLRRCSIEEVGGMDECFFLYYEEIDLARRLKNEGYTWVFLSTAAATHIVAGSSGKAPLRPFYERYKSMCYYFKKHHHPFSAFIVRQLLYIMVFLRWGCVLLDKRFRLAPGTPLSAEIEMYRSLVGRRKKPAPRDIR